MAGASILRRVRVCGRRDLLLRVGCSAFAEIRTDSLKYPRPLAIEERDHAVLAHFEDRPEPAGGHGRGRASAFDDRRRPRAPRWRMTEDRAGGEQPSGPIHDGGAVERRQRGEHVGSRSVTVRPSSRCSRSRRDCAAGRPFHSPRGQASQAIGRRHELRAPQGPAPARRRTAPLRAHRPGRAPSERSATPAASSPTASAQRSVLRLQVEQVPAGAAEGEDLRPFREDLDLARRAEHRADVSVLQRRSRVRLVRPSRTATCSSAARQACQPHRSMSMMSSSCPSELARNTVLHAVGQTEEALDAGQRLRVGRTRGPVRRVPGGTGRRTCRAAARRSKSAGSRSSKAPRHAAAR